MWPYVRELVRVKETEPPQLNTTIKLQKNQYDSDSEEITHVCYLNNAPDTHLEHFYFEFNEYCRFCDQTCAEKISLYFCSLSENLKWIAEELRMWEVL